MIWIIVVAVLVVIAFVLDREIYFYEGVHLGPRMQAWLYDRWSKKYDEGKRASQLQDDEMLAVPLLEALNGIPRAFVLDFATGTGRLSSALLSRPEFQGHIIALDLSQGMLEQAARKLDFGAGRSRAGDEHASARSSASVELLRHKSLPLPFPDGAFDVVCALEVLELLPNMETPLQEFARVLRPGGILLTSRGTEESGRRAKVRSTDQFVALLEGNGFQKIRVRKWWKLFDRVIAVNGGSSLPVGARRLSDVMRCPACLQTYWQKEADAWKCQPCGKELSVTEEGILLN